MKGNKSLAEEELEVKIIQLKYWYNPIDSNPDFHSNKVQCVKRLNAILNHVHRQDLQKANIREVVRCALTIIYYFSMQLKLSKSTSKHFSRWRSKKQFLKAEAVFQKTMDKLLPECSQATTTIMLEFFANAALWPLENFVGQILELDLRLSRQPITVLDMILTDIRCVLFRDTEGTRQRIKVLYDLLKSECFVLDTPKVLWFVDRLLNYLTNNKNGGSNDFILNTHLKKGIDICMRRIFEIVGNEHRLAIITTMLNRFSAFNEEDEDVVQFSALIQYAAELYKVGCPFSIYLPEDLMSHILISFVGSTNPLHSLVGCRLIQHFLDRQLNAQYLVEPKCYYQTVEMKLNNGENNECDREFMKRHEEKINEYFILAITRHCENSKNLKAVFTVVCCMVLEVPCGMTAAAAAFMMMVVQEFALHEQNISPRSKHWMHAIVISVMSLICWVHKAPFLYKYVNQIMTSRALAAPQLNPPLLQEYNVRTTHLWTNNKALFFKDWELRYGLWKAFSDLPCIDILTK